MGKFNSRSSRLQRRQRHKRETADNFRTTPPPKPLREAPKHVADDHRISRFVEHVHDAPSQPFPHDGPSQPSVHEITSEAELLEAIEKHFPALPAHIKQEAFRRFTAQLPRPPPELVEKLRSGERSQGEQEDSQQGVPQLPSFPAEGSFIGGNVQPKRNNYPWWWDLRSQLESNPQVLWPLYRPLPVHQLLNRIRQHLAIVNLCSAVRDISLREDPTRLPHYGPFLDPVRPARELSWEQALHILYTSPSKASTSPPEANPSRKEANTTPTEANTPPTPGHGTDQSIAANMDSSIQVRLKTELLRALSQTSTDGTVNENQIPTSPDDVVLGVPTDPNNLSQTKWSLLIVGSDTLDDTENGLDIGGAGKKKNAKAKAKASAALNSPQGQGLKDGSVLAFRFKKAAGEGDAMKDGKFDVKVPTYDDPSEVEEQDEEIARGA